MEFAFDATIDHSLHEVLPLLRDRLPEVVPYLPTIARIEIVEREIKESGQLFLVRLWEGNSKMIPPVARPFVTRAMRTWKDFGLWSESEREARIEWRFEPHRFARLFTCDGVNYLEDLGDGTTRVRMTGKLVVHPAHVPGLPEGLAKKLVPTIERFVVGKIRPNLAQVPRAVRALLEAERTARQPAEDS